MPVTGYIPGGSAKLNPDIPGYGIHPAPPASLYPVKEKCLYVKQNAVKAPSGPYSLIAASVSIAATSGALQRNISSASNIGSFIPPR